MRRIAALYDVHGNLPGLEAVLSEVESAGVDLVDRNGRMQSIRRPRRPELRRTDYNRDVAAMRIRASGWPTAERFVREDLLTVPAATAAIGRFERMAGRG